ncbi:hypothetical protein [Nocardia amikacinitolerans]|uniref:hypothetical protein n=1 Tax=Nocardia amikacinitolerans TaxID=756689 RepID=UPI0020A44BA4|nr:hypothetical protein [Nocardia amikacinitolerans]
MARILACLPRPEAAAIDGEQQATGYARAEFARRVSIGWNGEILVHRHHREAGPSGVRPANESSE